MGDGSFLEMDGLFLGSTNVISYWMETMKN